MYIQKINNLIFTQNDKWKTFTKPFFNNQQKLEKICKEEKIFKNCDIDLYSNDKHQ